MWQKVGEFGRMFIGSYDYNLDTKGRLVIPSKFRGEIGNDLNVYLTRGFDGCLSIYKEEDFEKVVLKYQAKSYEKSEVRKALRSFLDSVVQLSLDNQGRILIPSKVLEKFNIGNKVHILGAIDHFEIWDFTKWNDEESSIDDEFEINAEKIFSNEE